MHKAFPRHFWHFKRDPTVLFLCPPQANSALEKKCVLDLGNRWDLEGDFRVSSNIVWGYRVDENRTECANVAKTEPAYVQQLKLKQTARMFSNSSSSKKRKRKTNITLKGK